MAYKWKPSKSQRKAFAARMQDPGERMAYEARKEAKAEKRRADSQFSYTTAGGWYIPTQHQHDMAMKFLVSRSLTDEQQNAAHEVIRGYGCAEKIHHDYIHIINELIRKNAPL